MADDVRLIDAVSYCKELKEEMNYPGRSEEFMIAIDVAIADLADMPTTDAVEVVRCGECRFCDTADCPMIGSPGRVSASDFCSYGERRCDNG